MATSIVVSPAPKAMGLVDVKGSGPVPMGV